MQTRFTGTGVALVTPFTAKKDIDFQALAGIIDRVIEGGVEYVVLLGTTGESVTLSPSEKKELVSFVPAQVKGRVPVVLGIGGNHTQGIITQIEQTNLSGISAILSVSPYYNKPTQTGIIAHFSEIARNSPLPLIMYNIPGRSGSNMTANTTLYLSRSFENIIAIKEASGDLSQVMHIIKDKPAHFQVISGDDNLTFPYLSLGVDGVISVTAQAVPELFSEMVRLVLAGNILKARNIQYKLLPLMDLLFADGSPGGIKAALSGLGLCANELRLPLVPVRDEVSRDIVLEMKHLLG